MHLLIATAMNFIKEFWMANQGGYSTARLLSGKMHRRQMLSRKIITLFYPMKLLLILNPSLKYLLMMLNVHMVPRLVSWIMKLYSTLNQEGLEKRKAVIF